MEKTKKPANLSGQNVELLDLIPRIKLFPEDDPEQFETLRQAFLSDLSPGTAYETSLAENLVNLEWEAVRHRRIRDSLILAKIRDLAIGAFQNGEAGCVEKRKQEPDAEKFAFALVSPREQQRRDAAIVLTGTDIDRSELHAKAYQQVLPTVTFHEQHLANIEVRKRRLREDLDRLKSMRKTTIADAEVLDSQ